MVQQSTVKTSFYSLFALIAFAGNSVLCRLALNDQSIDPASFTVIRLLSGIVVLWPLVYFSKANQQHVSSSGSWMSALMLFIYALLFSYAYVSIDTATGALILFGVVQVALIFISLIKGNKLRVIEYVGVLIAFSGFAYLVLPEIQKPSVTGFVMMSVAGIAWAMYTVGGQGSVNALRDTAFNFLRTAPFVIVLLAISFDSFVLSPTGITLAIASGALTSGIGYAIWYAAVPNLTTTQAGVIQLFVPIIAAVGGVLFANEAITFRLMIATSLILGGIMLIILTKPR